MKKIIDNIIKYKYVYLICLFALMVFLYTHFNTFLANDDLPYSFYYRGETRITTLGQVLANQLADYKFLNGRFFVHCVLQIVLMFDKNLWSVINPIMIITSLILICNLIKLKSKKINFTLSIMIAFCLFLLLIDYKHIIYWVAGSVNYVWVFTLLTIFIYLFYKYGFSKYKIINTFGIALLCAVHECTMVFTIVFILSNMIYDWIKYKKFNKDYIWYILGFLGSLILLLSPANNNRLVSDDLWNRMSFIEKLLTSIPVVSKNLFNLKNIYNILPYFFVGAIIINLIKVKNKCSLAIIITIILNILLIVLIQNNWLYFSLTLLLVLGEFYCHFKNNTFLLCLLSLSFYAVVFSNIITPLYAASRPNFYFYLYIIFYFIYTLNNLEIKKDFIYKIVYGVTIIAFIFLFGVEIYTYNLIGNYHNDRLNSINEYKENVESKTLYLKKIPSKLSMYRIDSNLPTKDWFTYRYYLNYYELPEDTNIVYR